MKTIRKKGEGYSRQIDSPVGGETGRKPHNYYIGPTESH